MGITTVFSLPKSVTEFLNNNFERWLARRIPERQEHQLNSRNIMIYPTRFGLSYLGFVVLVFLLGTNYQNNIILLFSYLLASLFISVMLHSFYNFSQLRFYSVAQQQGFSKDILYFPIQVMANKTHFDLNFYFTTTLSGNNNQKMTQCDEGASEIKLSYQALIRGKHQLGRVTVFSEYSLGLFKSKSVLNFGHTALVYPKPKRLIAGQYKLSSQSEDPNTDNQQTVNLVGTDDFSELKSFMPGESRSRTAWKQLAKGQGHFSKHYQEGQGQLQWLKLSEMPSNDIEEKLAYLSFLVLELSASNETFGLEIYTDIANNSANIAPNTGAIHQQDCLTALALYP
jgi:uncharacterized protein (DUF58 family)